MYGYKCDKCGRPVNIDPSEERICDLCLKIQQARKCQPAKIEYRAQKQDVYHVGG